MKINIKNFNLFNIIFTIIAFYIIYLLIIGLFVDTKDLWKILINPGSLKIISFISFLTFSFFLFSLIVKKLNILLLFILLNCSLFILTNTFNQLFFIFFLFFSSAILGKTILRFFNLNVEEDLTRDIFLGIGVLAFAANILFHYTINSKLLYYFILLLINLINYKYVIDLFNQIFFLGKSFFQKKIEHKFLTSLILAIFCFYIVQSLVPQHTHDALVTHQYVPNFIKHNLYWHFNYEEYIWALYPNNALWINSLLYILGGDETGLIFLACSYILFICYLINRIFFLFHLNSKIIKYILIIFLSTPLTLLLNINLFTESLWCVFFLISFYYLIKISKIQQSSLDNLSISILFFGFAISTKQQAFLIAPVYFIYFFKYYKNFITKITPYFLIKISIIFLFVGLIPYFKAWYLTGNPFFPFFNEIFKSPYFDNWNFKHYDNDLKINLIYLITFFSEKYGEVATGAFGFQWLLILPFCLLTFIFNFKKIDGKFILLAAFVIFLLIFYFSSYVRYTFPSLILFLIFIGISLNLTIQNQLNFFNQKIFNFFLILAISLNILFVTSSHWKHKSFSFSDIFNVEEFNMKHSQIKYYTSIINQLNLHNENVIFFAPPYGANLRSKALYLNWHNPKLLKNVNSIKNSEDFLKILEENKIKFLIIDKKDNIYQNKKEIISKLIEPIIEFSDSDYGIYQLKKEYEYREQLLKSPNFENPGDWNNFLEKNKNLDSDKGIIVGPTLTQTITIKPGSLYKNTIIAKCHLKETFGRVQINWYGNKNNFLTTNLKVFKCGKNWEEHSMFVKAPKQAVSASIYTGSHLDLPILVKSNLLFKK